jgi:hypothetical protein
VASILLLREWQSSSDGRASEYAAAIEASISLLEQVEARNEIARHAIQVLRTHLQNLP